MYRPVYPGKTRDWEPRGPLLSTRYSRGCTHRTCRRYILCSAVLPGISKLVLTGFRRYDLSIIMVIKSLPLVNIVDERLVTSTKNPGTRERTRVGSEALQKISNLFVHFPQLFGMLG